MKFRIVKSILCLAMTVPFMAFAHTGITNLSGKDEIALAPMLIKEYSPSENSSTHEFELCVRHDVAARSTDSDEYFHAVLSKGGTLGAVLGEKLYEIESIVVEGPVNEADFNTLWEATFNGHLKNIDLQKATVENGKIPDKALFHIDAQVNWETMVITTTWLEKLILPDGVTEIGEFAVAYATALKEIKFPKTLQTIGKAAFTDCISLTAEQLVFPESLSVIGEQAFYQCRGLTGKITLPSSLKAIVCGAFYCCKISEINFPQSLEYLGCMAFANSALEKAILPDNCALCSEGGQFYNIWTLAEAHLPNNLTLVPNSVFSGCFSLKKVNVPSRAVIIAEFAFDQAKMSDIDFPETLESIEQDAFQSCNKLTAVVLPSSLKSLGDRAFALCGSLQKIYCKATVPPACIPASGYESDGTPFASVNPSTPVYIPVGTKQQYVTAPGWDYMTNFIETDDFPAAGVESVATDVNEQDGITYDLFGRKVETLYPGNIYIRNGKKLLIK